MADLEGVPVKVFDPATPFKKVIVEGVGVDSWYQSIMITKTLRSRLPYIAEIGKRGLHVSGGMSIKLPVVEIGIQIGSIEISETEALVVDDGEHDLVLGSHVFNEAFREKVVSGSAASGGSAQNQGMPDVDANSLSVDLYPVAYPFRCADLENMIKAQRMMLA